MHKLLFDNNISHRVIARINKAFGDSTHVMLENLDKASDIEVWKYASDYGYTIVTKDSDFNDIAAFRGIPPKIIWIRVGNCKVDDIRNIIMDNEIIIKAFLDDKNSAILEI